MPPVALKQRRIPFHIRKKVHQALDKLLAAGLIEKVPEGEPTPWVSPIVAVPQKDNSIRLCTDMRQPNIAIKRTRFPIPTLKDDDVALNGAAYFSKLDVRQAFHQLELDESSRYITTFATHRGLFRNTVLNFGTNAASEIFQQELQRHLEDIIGALNIHDDIIIFGRTREDHDLPLENCLQRLSDIGVTLNLEKCGFLQEELSFFGHIYSKDGVRPDDERVTSILNLEPPSTIREMRSFLGMINYCSRFIENYSTVTSPLREAIKGGKMKWNEECEDAFQSLKKKLTSGQVMAYFDINKGTELYVDASPVGLSAILMQRNKENGEGRVVAYGSRSLSRVEQRYSQTEKEALAIVWGVEYFHEYIYGSLFTIITDHKPLEVIYGSPSTKVCATIERWTLRLQPYVFKVVYRKGKDNPADYLSRHPLDKKGSQERYTEHYINFLTKFAVPKAMSLIEIITETRKDKICNLLIQAIKTNDWAHRRLHEYNKLGNEFSVSPDGIILRGNLIVLPESLWGRAVEIAHETHQGIEKTKALLREKIWFPKMDTLIRDKVHKCIPCLMTGRDAGSEPIKMTKMPEGPWQHVHVDFKGPLPTGKYAMVIIDRYSRYPEVAILKSIKAKSVIGKLRIVFASHGIPNIVTSDNGPPFTSAEFSDYMKEIGSRHQLSTPYWPQGNAEVERFMKTLGKLLIITNVENRDFETMLSKFLFQYRTTPHSTTKVSPAELLYNRKLAGKIPTHVMEKVVDRHNVAKENEALYKAYNKAYADKNRRTRCDNISAGDSVLIKQKQTTKVTPRFNPRVCTVINVTGPTVTAITKEGKFVSRNKSFFKKVPQSIIDEPMVDSDSEDEYMSASNNSARDTEESTEDEQTELRRSTRTRTVPERYGERAPSEVVDDVISQRMTSNEEEG